MNELKRQAIITGHSLRKVKSLTRQYRNMFEAKRPNQDLHFMITLIKSSGLIYRVNRQEIETIKIKNSRVLELEY